jgi:16S rRNA (uracil1498-N3)-methyltransferase
MRLHRFYIDQTIDKEKINLCISAPLVHQLRRVMRLHTGDKAIFFDGSGNEYEAEIVSMTDERLEFRVLETRIVKQHAKRKLSLAFSLIKKDNAEWVIEKGTELGVFEFIPLVSERSEKKGFNMERARKIMIEACEQSGRGEIPTLREPVELEDFLKEEKRKMFAFHTDESAPIYGSSMTEAEVVACVGPEGGWSEEEVRKFKEKGVEIARLDTPILRAETAAIAITTLLLV